LGIFRGTKNNGVADLEREIDGLRTRRKALLVLQDMAGAALQKALDDRKNRLVEADIDENNAATARALVIRLRDENESTAEALAAVNAKISDAEARLAAERELRKRDTERELRMNQVAACRDALDEFKSASIRLVEALAPLAGIGALSAAAHVNAQYLTGELAKGVQGAFDEAQFYVEGVVNGGAPIKVDAPVLPVAPPPPAAVERKQIFLRHPGRWTEAGEVITAGKHTTPTPPLAIALAAIEHGHAVDPSSRVAQELRRLQDPDFAFQRSADCFDISQPMPEPRPAEVHVASPPVHSTLAPVPGPYAGVAMTGTAVATPPVR
jgi:hypothetical protein